jgi:hypothetical protein
MTTTNDLNINQNGIPIYDNLTGSFSNTQPPADQVLVGGANSTIQGVDPTGFDAGNPLCSTGVGTPPDYSASPVVDSITIQNLPTNPQDGANKAYVDSVASGITFLDSALLGTTAALTATYNNGVAGVGATLTNNGVQAPLDIDGQTVVLGDRILVKDQVAQEENGVYEVTDVGTIATNWELTRTTDFDQPAEIIAGSIVSVLQGATNAETFWAQTQNITTIGTDPLIFIPFNSVPSNVLISTNNLSDVANAATSRTNLGLTNVATQNVTQYSVIVGGAGDSLVSLPTGSAGQVLVSGGGGANPSFQTVSVTGITQVKTVVFTSSGTYTPTPNMQYCIVEVVGGGGGSGGVVAVTSPAIAAFTAGGGGGCYGRKLFTAAQVGASQTVQIGAGGTAGAAGNNNGGKGGTTNFGVAPQLLFAEGGVGGAGGSLKGFKSSAIGSKGGSNSNGDVVVSGNYGGYSFSFGESPVFTAIAGAGGSSFLSSATNASITNNGFPLAGENYGGGASGQISTNYGATDQPAKAGAAGASGICIITEYIG